MSEVVTEPELSRRRRIAGKSLIYGAHAVTAARAVATVPVVLNHVQNKPTTVRQGIGVGVIGALDKVDGFLARTGHRILGTSPSDEAKRFDELVDKGIFHAMCLSIIVRRLRQHDFVGAAVMAGLQAVPAVRDSMITDHRNHLPEGIDPSPVKISKWKTGTQNTGLSLLSGILPEDQNLIGDIVIAASDVMGVVGYRQQVTRDQAAIDAQQATLMRTEQFIVA